MNCASIHHASSARRGFTLLEILLASSIFVIVVAIGFSMYVSITQVQQGNLNNQRLFSESRFIFDVITSDLQNGVVDYSAGFPLDVPEDELQMITSTGLSVRYYLDTVDGSLKREINGGAPEPLSSADIQVTQFGVYVYPLLANDTEVPIVTIVWRAQEATLVEPETIEMQTTISLRNR